MSLNNAISIATSGLSTVEHALSVASNNISNADTGGYIKEVANVESVAGNGVGNGVRKTTTTLATNTTVQKALYAQNADVAAYSVTSDALSTITALQGSTSASSGSDGTLSDYLGDLQSALTSLTSTPSDTTYTQEAVSYAEEFANSVNAQADQIQTERQDAQDSIVSSVADINTDLTTIGKLSSEIISLKNAGEDTADLENQRYTALSDLSSQLGITYTESANGDMTVTTATGLTLPTHDTNSDGQPVVSSTWPLSTSPATITAASSYSSSNDSSDSDSIPAVTLNGVDVTDQLTGGTLGANITLRDTTLPTMQAQLDSLSYTVASRFSDAGLTLFTTSGGSVPGDSQTTTVADGGSVGFAQEIQVSSTYADDPSLISSGDDDSSSTAQNVLNYAFGTTRSDGSDWTAAPSSGLGVTGTLSTGYSGDQDIIDLATALTANQAEVADDASSNLTLAQNTQSNLSTSLSDTSSVSVDDEMSNIVTLQNAYAANAKVISMAQTMFTSLIDAVGG